MGCLVERRGTFLLRADEKLARRNSNSIRDWRVKRLRTCAHNLRRIGHTGDDLFDSINRIVLMRFDLRQLVDYSLGKIALFHIEHAIQSEQESSARFLLGFSVVELLVRLQVFDLPESDD